MKKEPMELSVYKKILAILFISFPICIIAIVILQLHLVEEWIQYEFGQIGYQLFNQFFLGALGGTIAGSLFLKKDKEINEKEYLKAKSDPTILRLPDEVDKQLYIQRIITSGILTILGTLLIIAGFSYLEVDYKNGFLIKQKIFFSVTSMLIGLYQFKFLGSIEKISDNLFKSSNKKPDLD